MYDEFTKQKNHKIETGYVLEVDLEYPAELRAFHKDFNFCPENMKIGRVEKLVCNLHNKEKYPTHITTAVNVLKLTNLHQEIGFQQIPWLKPYIYLNTGNRTNAKKRFKLMNNSVFGKTMEIVRVHKLNL